MILIPRARVLATCLAVAILGHATAYGQGSVQASITGLVRDTSGAVLPGVTVEASSGALIEKTRSAVTDGAGRYRLVELPPGAYTITYSLSGFNTVRREGLELSGSLTATIDIDLRVGSLQETIT
ncbi:MAG TPA: carboxypeptidase-like regulatory domain-containing protein, partial [Gemmatimonadaceae bacterium]|nr:carboxypeptidase-like regulatory domain-containing protein [Gemmatimonadaceae bacterium]